MRAAVRTLCVLIANEFRFLYRCRYYFLALALGVGLLVPVMSQVGFPRALEKGCNTFALAMGMMLTYGSARREHEGPVMLPVGRLAIHAAKYGIGLLLVVAFVVLAHLVPWNATFPAPLGETLDTTGGTVLPYTVGYVGNCLLSRVISR